MVETDGQIKKERKDAEINDRENEEIGKSNDGGTVKHMSQARQEKS